MQEWKLGSKNDQDWRIECGRAWKISVSIPLRRVTVSRTMWAEDPAAIQKHLASQTKIMISGGLVPTMGKAIRVGLMGRTATDEMVDRVLEGVAQALGKPSPQPKAGEG